MNKDISMRKAIEGRFRGYESIYLAFCYSTKNEPQEKYVGKLPVFDLFFADWIGKIIRVYDDEFNTAMLLSESADNFHFLNWLWGSVLEGREIA